MNLNPYEELAVIAVLTAIRSGEFAPEDHSDLAVRLAITEGCVDGDPLHLTERGEAELKDYERGAA